MKKNSFMLVLASLLFVGLVASCSKDNSNGGDPVDPEGEKTFTGEIRLNAGTSLSGSDYYLMSMGEKTKTQIASKVTKDYRTDEQARKLDIWEGTFVAGTMSGKSFYDDGGWICFNVNNKDWAGLGMIDNSGADFTQLGDDHYLHLAIKTKSPRPIVILLTDDSGAEVRLGLYNEEIVDGEKVTHLVGDFDRDGEWQEIEIPLSIAFKKGLKFQGVSKKNMFGLVILGAPVGTNINLDAIFFYKPAK